MVISTLMVVASVFAYPAPVIDMRCGANCVYLCLKSLDLNVGNFSELMQRLGPPSAKGYSLAQLADVAESYGAHTLGVVTDLERLGWRRGRFAIIAKVGTAHFVNLSEVSYDGVHIVDAPLDYVVPSKTFEQTWDGSVLLISAATLDPEEDLHRPLRMSMIVFGAVAVTVTALGATAILRSRRRR